MWNRQYRTYRIYGRVFGAALRREMFDAILLMRPARAKA